jgi:hypothetical protein
VRREDHVTQLRHQVLATASGFFPNLVTDGTCTRCYTPVHGTVLCPRCQQDDLTAGLPDARGFITYAAHHEPIQQSGQVMRDYKTRIHPSRNAKRTVALLAALALRGHRHCPGHIVGTAPTAWSAVPSLPPGEPDSHPLVQILRSLAKPRSVEIVLRGIDHPADPRGLSAGHFTVQSIIPRNAHVLLIDDTWTTGGHAQSAALALRTAGAAHVSLLIIARWLTVGWGATTPGWMRANLTDSYYNPYICPWTQGPCPT